MVLKDGAIRKIADNKVYLNPTLIKQLKISSRLVGDLLGLNQWNSVGKSIIDRLGLFDYDRIEPIDPYYTVRGEVAEIFAVKFLHETYKKFGVEIETKTFPSRYKGSNGQWYGNNLYRNNEKFSGVNDIGISSPASARANCEVKSKSDKSYEYIINRKIVPQEELMQGKVLSTLAKTEKLLMIYVFFDEDSEVVMKDFTNKFDGDINDLNETNLKPLLDMMKDYEKLGKIRIEVLRYDIDLTEVEQQMEMAYQIVKEHAEKGYIELDLFSDDDKQTFKNMGLEIEVGLPF